MYSRFYVLKSLTTVKIVYTPLLLQLFLINFLLTSLFQLKHRRSLESGVMRGNFLYLTNQIELVVSRVTNTSHSRKVLLLTYIDTYE